LEGKYGVNTKIPSMNCNSLNCLKY